MIRIYKRHLSNQERFWTNTYEFRNSTTKTDVINYIATINAITEFERKLHVGTTLFNRAVVSTWVEDGQPYNPASFAVVELNELPGTRIAGGDQLPLNYVLNVKKSVEYGRSGRFQYRNVLQEQDVTSTSGTPQASNASNLRTLIQDALATTGLGNYLAGGSLQGEHVLSLVGGPLGTPQSRAVNGLDYGSVGITKFNHKYFDRL
jgi:hypothetical protein